MIETALMWLFFNLITIAFLAFFSMEEMACVSFNRIRLQFLIKQEGTRADWIHYLLQNPSRLFGTTLIGVNVATVVGSECARQFLQTLDLNPDLAPLFQVIIVIIFGELAPMFAARRYPEHVALLGAPVLYLTSKILAPLIWALGLVSRAANFLVGGKESHPDIFLTQDELQKVIEEQDEEHDTAQDTEELNAIAANIFHLRDKTAKHVMTPFSEHFKVPSQMTIEKVRKTLDNSTSYLPVYHKEVTNIIGVAFVRELIRAPNARKIKDYIEPPWFISERTPLFQILKQFRRNSEHVAIIINDRGEAKGLLNFNLILEEIFGKAQKKQRPAPAIIIDRTLPGDMSVHDFNLEFGSALPYEKDETLSEMIIRVLGHHPEPGETIQIAPFEFTVKEATLLEIKTLAIQTKV